MAQLRVLGSAPYTRAGTQKDLTSIYKIDLLNPDKNKYYILCKTQLVVKPDQQARQQ